MKYIKTIYASITSSLASYLKNREITYDLLWALFRSNTIVYMIILDVEKSACYKFNFVKKRIISKITYFHVKCSYLDFNEQVFEKAYTAIEIWTFQDAKSINRLETLFLKYHHHADEMRKHLLRCDQQFVFLMSQHHVQYRDNIFYIENREYIQVLVNSHIMINVSYFRKINLNYFKLHINELIKSSSLNDIYVIFYDTKLNEVKRNDLDSKILSEDDLIICSQTVYDWSYDNKH